MLSRPAIVLLDFAVYAALANNRTVFYTPEVLTTPRQLRDALLDITTRVDICIGEHLQHINQAIRPHPKLEGNVELIIVDESERLTATGFEVLRGRYDRDQIGLILIGMPGLEKQFSRYPQFYSHVGFAHEYRALSRDELRFVLDRHWHRLGLTLDPAGQTVGGYAARGS